MPDRRTSCLSEHADEQERSRRALDASMGRQIRARRRALKVSQTTLANAIGVAFQQIQKYEHGANRVSFSRLVDIAHALDCRVVDLIGDLDKDGVPSPAFQHDAAHLREPGAERLLQAYAAAPPRLRKIILSLVVELAKDHRE